MNTQFIQLLTAEIDSYEERNRQIGEQVAQNPGRTHFITCFGDAHHQRRARIMQLVELIEDKETRESIAYRVRRMP